MSVRFPSPDATAIEVILSAPEYYELYIDTLMLIQEMLSAFSTAQEHPRLSAETVDRNLSEILSRNDLPLTLKGNIVAIAAAGRELLHRAKAADGNSYELDAIDREVTQFLDQLIQVYMEMRTLKRGSPLQRKNFHKT